MRHLKRGRKLSRTSSHRKAMFRNMVAALFRHGRIITTPAKAKEARPFAEKLITLAKRGPNDLAARRRAIQLLHDPALVKILFEDLGVRYQERPGGYTRILHLARTRVGDGAPQVLFELVEGGAPAVKNKGERPQAAVVEPAPAAVGGESMDKKISDHPDAGAVLPSEAAVADPADGRAIGDTDRPQVELDETPAEQPSSTSRSPDEDSVRNDPDKLVPGYEGNSGIDAMEEEVTKESVAEQKDGENC